MTAVNIGVGPPLEQYQRFVENKHGIEIGGPSTSFKTVLPLYRLVAGLDGVNFSTDTVWQGWVTAEDYNKKFGQQFIAEATDLSEIADARYDFVLASHCLEHIANPIKALMEWKRLTKAGGGLILVLPNKETNFDHRRPVTTFEHLWDDFTQNVGEDDLTHLDEILALYDLSLDPGGGDPTEFRERSLKNFQNRTLHHHVFDVELIETMLDRVGLEVLDITIDEQAPARQHWADFFILGRWARDDLI